jgi:hypothetical protein
MWFAPARTASSASARTRARPSLSASASPAAKLQSTIDHVAAEHRDHRLEAAFDTNGLSSCRISVWLLSSSSTFLRLPNRVLRLITRCSRKLSIAGLVTWLKFCRK